MTRTDKYTEGWGVVDDRGLDVRTVSESRQAAIVKWLVLCARVKVHDNHDDTDIEYLWACHGRDRAEAHQVNVYVAASPQ